MQSRADGMALAIVLIASCAYQYVFMHDGIGLIDEGHLAQGALRVSRGEVLYRDIYTVYPPASFYVVAGLFDVFGPSLIVVRAFHLVMTVALACVAFSFGRLFMTTPFALLAGLLVGVTGWEALLERCHYAFLYSVFPLASLGVLVASFESERKRALLLLAGVLAGTTLLFRLVPFVGLSAAAIVVLSLRERSLPRFAGSLGLVVAGGLLVIVPIVLAFAWGGALESMGRAVLWTSVSQYAGGGELNLPFPDLRLWPGTWSAAGLSSLFRNWEFYLPIALYGAAAIEFAFVASRSGFRRPEKGFGRSAILRLALAIFGAILFLRATGRSDYYHLAPVLVPAYLLGADLLSRGAVRAFRGGPAWTGYAVVSLLMLLSLGLHDVPNAVARSLDRSRVELSPGGPRLPARNTIDDLVAAVQARTEEGEAIVVLPWYPILYFVADRPNPTRFDWLFPGYLQSAEDRRDFLRAIESSGASLVVYAPGAIDGLSDRRLSVFEPEIDAYLRRRFRGVGQFGRFVLLEKLRR